MDKMAEMDIEILNVISKYTIFSFKEIKDGYLLTKSFDKLIDATIEAPRIDMPLIDMCILVKDLART